MLCTQAVPTARAREARILRRAEDPWPSDAVSSLLCRGVQSRVRQSVQIPSLERGTRAMRTASAFIVLGAALCAGTLAAESPLGTWNVVEYGAKGDGRTDDTAAFQRALDAAGKAGGGIVLVPRGVYRFAGHLNVPSAVTLKGIWESVPPTTACGIPVYPSPPTTARRFWLRKAPAETRGPPSSP